MTNANRVVVSTETQNRPEVEKRPRNPKTHHRNPMNVFVDGTRHALVFLCVVINP